VSGTGVVTSSLRRVEGGVEIRLVAMTAEPTRATVTGPFTRTDRTDLLGRLLEQIPSGDGRLTLDLAPWEIATILVS
jgi:alpha-mannosidase